MAYSLVDKLYASKPYTEDVDVLGRKITFRALGGGEEEKILRDIKGDTLPQILSGRRIPLLSRAITHIDGIAWKDFEEIKQRLHSNKGMDIAEAIETELREAHYTEEVISELYDAFSAFRERYRGTLDSLKKSSVAPNQETVG